LVLRYIASGSTHLNLQVIRTPDYSPTHGPHPLLMDCVASAGVIRGLDYSPAHGPHPLLIDCIASAGHQTTPPPMDHTHFSWTALLLQVMRGLDYSPTHGPHPLLMDCVASSGQQWARLLPHPWTTPTTHGLGC
jgi:hypothetical protein